ncbi:MAG: protein-disulfide reductase DsbD [Gammaproteobacteria bacterium]|nr:protein-disulfide reductase DsbD [Gammaproteobacteria bacterium]NNM14217.1 protein-disulfide reductase DsbD [Gammaproteobacteria bacterium]
MHKTFLKSLLTLSALLSGFIALQAADPLPVDQAFPQEVAVQDQHISLKISMRDDYYLYKHAFGFDINGDPAAVGAVDFPPAIEAYDEFVGDTEIYAEDLELLIPIRNTQATASDFIFTYNFQGCLTDSICYPPTTRNVVLDAGGGVSYVGTPIPEDEKSVAGEIEAAFANAPHGLDASDAVPDSNTSATPGETGDLVDLFGGGTHSQDEILPVDKAFQLTLDVTDDGYLNANWFAEPGYYLYQNKLTFESNNPEVVLGQPLFPKAKLKDDEIFGETPVYFGMANIRIPIIERPASATKLTLIANYQGCKEDSICYPPSVTEVEVNLPAGTAAKSGEYQDTYTVIPAEAEHESLAKRFASKNLLLSALLAFGFGVLLTFTPCVLPMVPILSGIITGGDEKTVSTRKAFNLSVIYVLSMALVFTLAGIITAKLGQNLTAAFQHPAVIIAFALIFLVLALSMFGLFEIQMPASVQTKLAEMSNKQESGHYLSAAIMGFLSALIVGPCVTPPLSALLLVIAESGDAVKGGVSLFALALGMGFPLIIFGTSMGKALPHAGAWMEHVKNFFGLLMLGLAVWMLERILPPSATLLLWSLLALLSAVFAGLFKPLTTSSGLIQQIFKGLGLLALLYSGLLLVGSLTGAKDPLRPLNNIALGSASIEHRELPFKRIKSQDDLQRELRMAASQNKSVFLDFYADWCIACKEMEKYTFEKASVQNALAGWVLLQADVTPNDDIDKALQQSLNIPGPPAMLFFDNTGKEISAMRLYGFKPESEFLAHLKRMPK